MAFQRKFSSFKKPKNKCASVHKMAKKKTISMEDTKNGVTTNKEIC